MHRSPRFPRTRILTIVLATVALAPACAHAAEIQLRSECHVRGSVVTLGDVAEISGGDAREVATLAAIELFPAPSTGQRFVRVREIQDLLLMRGVDLVPHRFSGMAQTTILTGDTGADTRVLAPAAVKKAERQASDAIAAYLRQRATAEAWRVAVTLDQRQARLVSAAGGSITVRGGTAPWVGLQHFEFSLYSPDGSVTIPLDATVALPETVVVTTRTIGRGAMIGPADVELQRVEAGQQGEPFHSLDEVIGKEAGQAIGTGLVLDHNVVRSPLVIHRGDVVTVFARTSGIRVKTVARARDEGSLGDLISVESLQDRKPYFVRVCGVQEVEVYARPMRSEEAAATDFSGFAARTAGDAAIQRR